MPCRLDSYDIETLRDALRDAYSRIDHLERSAMEFALLACELREHVVRSERLATRVQRLVA